MILKRIPNESQIQHKPGSRAGGGKRVEVGLHFGLLAGR